MLNIAELSKSGLNIKQVHLLSLIESKGRKRKELMKLLQISAPNLSARLSRLENKDLISKDDLITLTKSGKRLLTKIQPKK